MISIENEYIKVGILEHGAELCSYIDKKNKREVIWDGDSAYWKRHSPVLFPLIGKIENGEFRLGEKTYNLSAHGFARDKKFQLVNKKEDSITLELTADEETRKGYPFEFSLQVILTLQEKQLTVAYKIINTESNDIYFCVGAHPGIKVPTKKGLKYDDYKITFEKEEKSDRLLLTPEGFRTGKVEKEWLNGNTINLKEELFKDDALIFDDLKSKSLLIESEKGGDKVKVGWSNYPDMGIWKSYNNSPFICIEPWNGMADQSGLFNDFKDKKGVVKLSGNSEFECAFTIENITQ